MLRCWRLSLPTTSPVATSRAANSEVVRDVSSNVCGLQGYIGKALIPAVCGSRLQLTPLINATHQGSFRWIQVVPNDVVYFFNKLSISRNFKVFSECSLIPYACQIRITLAGDGPLSRLIHRVLQYWNRRTYLAALGLNLLNLLIGNGTWSTKARFMGQFQRPHFIETLPRLFDPPKYRLRSMIERMFSWLNENRWIVTRFHRLAKTYAAIVSLACAMRYLRHLFLYSA